MPEHHLDVRLTFNKEVPEDLERKFVELLADELEFRDKRNDMYVKQGWGMGASLIVKVERLVNDGFGRLVPESTQR